MEESEEVVYFELPPSYADKLILPMYQIVEGIMVALPGLKYCAGFGEMHDSVQERMKNADTEIPFIMTHDDCMAIIDMMSILKFYYYRVIMPNTDVRDSLSESDNKIMEMYEKCMTHISEIGEDIVAVFPSLSEPLFCNETLMKKEKDDAKSMGLDKTTMAIQISLADGQWATYMNTLFVFFEYFIIQGESNFSERVRAAPFCCVTEVREVHEIFKNATAETKLNHRYTTSFSLRDVVVLLMLNNISQKAFFSDCGDAIEDFLDRMMQKLDNYEPGKLRNFMLKHAKLLEEYMYGIAKNTEGFDEAMKPILAFEVYE